LPRARGSDSPVALRLLRATARCWSERREAGVLEETQETEEIIQRVAALDVAKAELTCCVRVRARAAQAGGSRRSGPTRR
jgi:hypothetical protein